MVTCLQPSQPAGFDLSVGFQPILHNDAIFAYRAEVTGPGGKAFEAVLGALDPDRRQALDSRRAALALSRAAAAGVSASGALLILPVSAAFCDPAAMIASIAAAATDHGIAHASLVIEISADERGCLESAADLAEAATAAGLTIALGAFASGSLGLNLLARANPRYVMLDRSLIRDIDRSDSRRLIVDGAFRLARMRSVTLIAPPTETRGELAALQRIGITHLQGGWAAPSTAARPVPPRREPRMLFLGSQRGLLAPRRPAVAQQFHDSAYA